MVTMSFSCGEIMKDCKESPNLSHCLQNDIVNIDAVVRYPLVKKQLFPPSRMIKIWNKQMYNIAKNCFHIRSLAVKYLGEQNGEYSNN